MAGFGLYRLLDRRHPRLLARIKPTQLALWSFLVAIAHGAGFLLVPIYLGLEARRAARCMAACIKWPKTVFSPRSSFPSSIPSP